MMSTSLQELVEAENQNLKASTTRLSETAELVNDFEDVYEAITPVLLAPEAQHTCRDRFQFTRN
jgi:hypothetical protein